MRFLLRLAVLGLAAVGAKSLYDRFAPKATELKEPMAGVLGSAKEAARDVSGHAEGSGCAGRRRRQAARRRREGPGPRRRHRGVRRRTDGRRRHHQLTSGPERQARSARLTAAAKRSGASTIG